MRSRIMIVGRDVALRAQLARLLNGRSYHVEIAENAEHARRVGLEGVALAIVAPDGLGPEGKGLLQELRAAVGSVLVIAAPGATRQLRADVIDISDETGLVARVAEALALAPEADEVEPVLQFGGYRLDLAGHCLVDQAGKEVPLTSGEFSLLRAFLKRPGRVLSRDQLLQVLTGRDAEAYDRSIDMLIVRDCRRTRHSGHLHLGSRSKETRTRPSTPGRTPCRRPRASFCAASRRRRSWLSRARAAAFASSIPRPTASTAIRRSRFPVPSIFRGALRPKADGRSWPGRMARSASPMCARPRGRDAVAGTSPISITGSTRLCSCRLRLSGARHRRRPSLSDSASGGL